MLQNDLAGHNYLLETITVKLLGLARPRLDGDQNLRAPTVSGKFLEQETLRRSVNQMMCFHAGWFSLRTNCDLEFFQTKQCSPLKVSKKGKTNCFLCSENQLDRGCEIITFEGEVLRNVTVKSRIPLENRAKPVEEISAATLGEKRGAAQLISSGSDHRAAGTDFLQAFTCSLLKRRKKKNPSVQINVYVFHTLCESRIQTHIRRGLHTLKGTVCAHTQVHTIDL